MAFLHGVIQILERKLALFFVSSSTAEQTHVENFILMEADVTKEEEKKANYLSLETRLQDQVSWPQRCSTLQRRC